MKTENDDLRRLHGCLGAAVSLTLSLLTALLLGRSWTACDVGVNNAANGSFLTLLFIPALWTILLLTWLATGALVGNRPRLLRAGALAATLLTVLWCATATFWGYPTPACPNGTPPWWPSLLPTPGF
ncbi:hypothetical protein ACK389_01390 [Streptomyces antibioticus]|uniref:Transmembrane protein n=1 Tax=Streptomyces antibioticus TaxID=1890 RepID=A0AAE6YGF0_STRAT|nr:hypothetical protein [Streptomyces antibioticus]OOQ48024.1 hypothetical protein AFM16_36055 [Streptomyces antibioticus]QIT48374.1 hypothetical protein HCX60_36660 [Streptomyces antibioticus]